MNDLIEEFVSKVDVFSAHEGRVARKFGLVYAAGQIAVEAGFLKPWENKGVPLRVTRRLFELAISKIDEEPTKLVSLLAEALQNHSIIPVQKGRAVLGEGEPFIALRFRRSGKNFIGLRVEELSNLSEGLGGVRSITTLLNDILEKGHGGKRTQQLNVSIFNEDGTLVTKKPRVLVVRRKKLEQFFSEQLQKPITLGPLKADRKPQRRDR